MWLPTYPRAITTGSKGYQAIARAEDNIFLTVTKLLEVGWPVYLSCFVLWVVWNAFAQKPFRLDVRDYSFVLCFSLPFFAMATFVQLPYLDELPWRYPLLMVFIVIVGMHGGTGLVLFFATNRYLRGKWNNQLIRYLVGLLLTHASFFLMLQAL